MDNSKMKLKQYCFLILFLHCTVSTTSTHWSKNPRLEDDEKDMVVLTENNFTEFISRNRYVMVNFYIPICSWSKPEYAAAATILKFSVILAKLDCFEKTKIVGEYRIYGYPTMYLFFGGDQMNFLRVFSRTDKKINNAVKNMTSIDDAGRVLASNSLLVLGILHSLQGEESKVLAAFTKQNIDIKFCQTTNTDVAKLFHFEEPQIKRPKLVMLEREGEIHTHFEGQFTVSEIADLVSLNKLPSVITYTIEDASRILGNPMKQLWLFTPEFLLEIISVYKEVAKIFKGKLLFVHADLSEEGADVFARGLSIKFGITGKAPTVVAYDVAATNKYHVHHGELTVSDIKSFVKEFLEDKFTEKSSTETLVRLPFGQHPAYPSAIPHTY
ncbi:Protein disulfide isomerase-like 1-4 [Euphorbia peplus]|nr:Protein disulfide isomerase-like 1-4 [Euphorbia peplus]